MRGVPDQQNLYVYHEGKVHYVTTLTGPPDCYEVSFGSFCRRMMRMQVSADGRYMAFLTASPDHAVRQRRAAGDVPLRTGHA